MSSKSRKDSKIAVWALGFGLLTLLVMGESILCISWYLMCQVIQGACLSARPLVFGVEQLGQCGLLWVGVLPNRTSSVGPPSKAELREPLKTSAHWIETPRFDGKLCKFHAKCPFPMTNINQSSAPQSVFSDPWPMTHPVLPAGVLHSSAAETTNCLQNNAQNYDLSKTELVRNPFKKRKKKNVQKPKVLLSTSLNPFFSPDVGMVVSLCLCLCVCVYHWHLTLLSWQFHCQRSTPHPILLLVETAFRHV